jgi:hypothetical protein
MCSVKEYIQHCYVALGLISEALTRMIGLKVYTPTLCYPIT